MPKLRWFARLAVAAIFAALLPLAPAGAASPAPLGGGPAAEDGHHDHEHDQATGGRPENQWMPEWVGTYQRVAKDLMQPDGTLRDVYDDVLVVGSRTFRLRLPKDVQLKGGTQVRVRGTLAGQDLTAAEVETVAAAGTVATTGTTKVLVILAHWNQPDSVTVAKARHQIFNDDNGWFGEASYGQLSLTGDVSGWHQIQAPTGGHCYANHQEIMTRAQSKAKAAGYDSVNYDRTIVYFPQCGGDAAGAAGWAYVPGDSVWLNGYIDRRVTVHEQGHNYGLYHAHTYDCSAGGSRVTLSTSCSFNEYGDDYDSMGGSDYAAHFSAAHKNQLGWLAAPGRKKTLSSTPTTFTLAPFAQVGTQPVAAVTGTSVASRKYWFEYRQAVGYDSALPSGATSGVLVHMTDSSVTGGGGAFLLDMSPQNGWGQAVIPPGGAWTSPEGVLVTVGSASAAGIEVTVGGGASPPVAPSEPQNVTATGGDESVRVAWDPPASNGGASVQSYTISWTGGSTVTVDGAQTSHTFEFLDNDTEYGFTVAARNSAGLGPASPLVKATPTALFPTIEVTSPAGGATVGGMVDLAASAAPNSVSQSPIDYVSFEVDGLEVDWDYTAPYTVEWDSTQVDDGPHTITATAYDELSRFKTSAPVAVEVRLPRPTVALTSPSATAGVITADTITLEADAEPAPDGAAIQWVEYELVDGTSIGYGNVEHPHTAVWDVAALNGDYDIVAKATDADGRTGTSAPVRVTIEHPVPSVTITSPAEGASVQDDVTVVADAVPNAVSHAPIDYVIFVADGTDYFGTDYDAPFEATWPAGNLTGEHFVTATAYDVDGRSAESARRTVSVDNPLPTVTITSPAEGARISGDVTFTAAAVPNVVSGSPIDRVEFTVDGSIPVPLDAPGPPYAATWDPGDDYGTHTAVAKAYDQEGRVGRSAVVTFVVPSPQPSVTITSPADGAVIGTGWTTITLDTSPDPTTQAPVDYAEFYVDGTEVGWDANPADGLTVRWYAAAGPHVLKAVVSDIDYFDGESEPVAVTVAQPPDAPTGVSAVAGTNGTAVVSWTPPLFTGGLPILDYTVRITGGAEFTEVSDSPFEVTGLSNGTAYTFTVKTRTAVGTGPASLNSNEVTPGTATSLSSSTSNAVVKYGKPVTVTGTLTHGGTGDPLADRTVQLRACTPASPPCETAGSARTASDGSVSIAYVPEAHRELHLRYEGGDEFLAATSVPQLVKVKAVVTAEVSTTSIVLGKMFRMSGRVKPAHLGAPVFLRRRTSTGWKTIDRQLQSPEGVVMFYVKPTKRGTPKYQLLFKKDTDHLGGVSATKTITVK